MAFTVPEFPLLCNIYTGPAATMSLRHADVPCNLAIGKRTQQTGRDRGGFGAIGVPPTLLLPGGTDIRDVTSSTLWDFVEVPSGSNRWYQVDSVEPLGYGFDNWHVCAALVKASENIDDDLYAGLVWPTPDSALMDNFT